MLKFDDISDNPKFFGRNVYQQFDPPHLFNIKTNRLFWHAGAGIDSEEIPDQHKHWIRNGR